MLRRRWLRQSRRRDRRIAGRHAVQSRPSPFICSPLGSLLYLVTSVDPVNDWLFATAIDPTSLPAIDTTISKTYSVARDAHGVHPGLLPRLEHRSAATSTSTIRTATTASRRASPPAAPIARRSAPCRRSCCARRTASAPSQFRRPIPTTIRDLPPLDLHRSERLIRRLHQPGPPTPRTPRRSTSTPASTPGIPPARRSAPVSEHLLLDPGDDRGSRRQQQREEQDRGRLPDPARRSERRRSAGVRPSADAGLRQHDQRQRRAARPLHRRRPPTATSARRSRSTRSGCRRARP